MVTFADVSNFGGRQNLKTAQLVLITKMVADLNKTYQSIPAMWEQDFTPEGFRWIDANDADNNVISFYRTSADGNDHLVCIANLSPVPRDGFRVGLQSQSFRRGLHNPLYLPNRAG